MHFVDADRASMPFLVWAFLHPFLVAPLITLEVVNHRRRLVTMLAKEPKWIALEQERASTRSDLVLVMLAFLHPGNENFPDTAPNQFAHRMHTAVPVIEVANDADSIGIRCPDREVNPAFATDLTQMRAELVVEPKMISFAEKMAIDLAHDRSIGIGVTQGALGTIKPDHLYEVSKIF